MAQLFIDIGRVLFIGNWDSTAEHTAMVPIIGAGLDGPIRLTVNQESASVRTAIVAANVPRSVEAFGKRLAVMPVDPLQVPSEIDEPKTLDALASLAASEVFDDAAWDALRKAARLPQSTQPTTAVNKAVSEIQKQIADNVSGEEIAQRVGYSLSHLQTLFRSELGVSMRSYRLWLRLRTVAEKIGSAATLTEAAISAGFYDSAHFANTFVDTFGVTPTSVFTPDLQIHVVPTDNL